MKRNLSNLIRPRNFRTEDSKNRVLLNVCAHICMCMRTTYVVHFPRICTYYLLSLLSYCPKSRKYQGLRLGQYEDSKKGGCAHV